MDKVITQFFGLSSPASVNLALNSQAKSVQVGTYKYVRLEFCKYNQGNSENIQWGITGGPVQQFQRNMCTVNSAEMNPPLSLAEGQTVTLTLSYDISQAVSTEVSDLNNGGQNQNVDCYDAGGGSYKCFTLPSFTPSAQVE